jgi:chromosome segregation ATPase
MALVTFDSVATAAQAITDEGGKASVRAVIQALGGGSPNAVLPLLNEWKAGRVVVRATDIALDPRIAALIAEQISTASVQAAKAAEDRASDVQADAEAIAEEGRIVEARAIELQKALDAAQAEIVIKGRALEDLAVERVRDGEIAQDKINTLQIQLDSASERAEKALQAVAKDEVKLQAIPKLEAQVERLAAFEQSAAVLASKLEDAQGVIEELRQRLAASEKATTEARAATDKANREAEQARIAEQSGKAKLESAQHETESLKGQLMESKAEIKEAREELKGLRAQLLEKQIKAEEKPKV